VLKTLEDQIASHYINSNDFNGVAIASIQRPLGPGLKAALADLVDAGRLSVQSERWNNNPSVKLLRDCELEAQLKALEEPGQCALYPTEAAIRARFDLDASYRLMPYSRRLAESEPQLTPVFFDLGVLERYREDPRYRFKFPHGRGSITLQEEVPDQDRIFMQSFGLGFCENGTPVVTAFLRYLNKLNSRHQLHWFSHEFHGDAKMSEVYYQTSILGDWPDSVDIFSVILAEMKILNAMSDVLERPPLFRKTFEETRPLEFSPFLRPTLHNSYAFALTLDKLMSDNLNKKFFLNEVPSVEYIETKDGRTIEKQIGTIRMLKEWLELRFKSSKPDIFKEKIIDGLTKIRRMRQKPAHGFVENDYDPDHWKTQRELLDDALEAVHAVRMILSNGPITQRVTIPRWLHDIKISYY